MDMIENNKHVFPILYIRWADTISSRGSDGVIRKFEHPFVQAVSMFIGEMLCLFLFKVLFYYYRSKSVSLKSISFIDKYFCKLYFIFCIEY